MARILGIAGSPRKGKTTEKLVKAILDASGVQTEFISLAGKKIQGCIACLKCTEDNVCKVTDDFTDLQPKILAADALVVGAPNYFGMINGLTHCLMERLYCFRHDAQSGAGGMKLKGKLLAAASVGGGEPGKPADNLKQFAEYHGMEFVGSAMAAGPVSCFVCGYGETCAHSGFRMFFGADAKITPDKIPALSKQPEALKCAEELGRKIASTLKAK